LATEEDRLVRRVGAATVIAGIVVALWAATALAAAGVLDITFGGDGKVTTAIGKSAAPGGVAIQPDGKIVAAGGAFLNGHSRFALDRYNTDGSLDTAFGGDGRVITRIGSDALALAVAIQPDGKIVAAGNAWANGHNRFALAR
jgi:uncharacterized delta-60 repeat protein